MKLINLTQNQYRNYLNHHKERTIRKTIEYSSLPKYSNYEKLYLGLINDQNQVIAASLILINHVSEYLKIAYANDGFLIDYNNHHLVKIFTEKLKHRLHDEKVTYLITSKMFKYCIYNKRHQIIENNQHILENLYHLGYQEIEYNQEWKRFEVILETKNNNYQEIYQGFNHLAKRNINEALTLGITLEKAKTNELNTFYDLIKKKKDKPITHYYNLINTLNKEDITLEIFFAKLNPEKFLLKTKNLYQNAVIKNENVLKTIEKRHGKMNETLLNKKIASEQILKKYHFYLNKAISLSNTSKNDITLGTIAIIKTNKEIYFLIDGYNEKYRYFHTSHLLKWAIIKKYSRLGYKIFNLGEINQNFFNKTNKYYNQYLYKMSLGGNIVEYPPNLMLIINKPIYQLYTKLNKLKSHFNK